MTVPEYHRYTWKFILNEGRRIFLDFPFEAGMCGSRLRFLKIRLHRKKRIPNLFTFTFFENLQASGTQAEISQQISSCTIFESLPLNGCRLISSMGCAPFLEKRDCSFTHVRFYSLFTIIFCSLVNLQKKIHMGMNLLQYFSTTKWNFQTEKSAEIRKKLSKEENQEFFTDIEKPEVTEYLKNCILGGRQYCLKEPLSSLPKARVQIKM